MLETRVPISSLPITLPRSHTRSAPERTRTAPVRERRASVQTAVPSARPERISAPITIPRRRSREAIIRSRLARSEARLLALTVTVTSLMCAVLVIYLAAYAHVTQLGLEKDMAKRQLSQMTRQNQQLQVTLTKLQDRSRITAAARALHMVPYTSSPVYINADGSVIQPGTQFDSQGASDAAPSRIDDATVHH
jgi:cell division protein FtsL